MFEPPTWRDKDEYDDSGEADTTGRYWHNVENSDAPLISEHLGYDGF
jgi:hypothetical protein